MTAKTIPPTATLGDDARGSGGLTHTVAKCPDTDAGHAAALTFRLKAALAALKTIAELRYSALDDAPVIAADALADDSHAEDATPPTAMQLLENWQAAHKGRIATVTLDGYWSAGVCRVALTPHEADEYSREVEVERREPEHAIRAALERWEENCECGRREEAELEAEREHEEAERLQRSA